MNQHALSIEPQQLELSLGSPFSVRLSIKEGIGFFRKYYWDHLPKGKTTGPSFARIDAFFESSQIRYVDEPSKTTIEELRRHLKGMGFKDNTINTHHIIVTRWYNKMYEWAEVGMVHGINWSKVPLPRKNPGSQVPKVNEKQFDRHVAWPKRYIRRLIRGALDMQYLDLAETIEFLYLTELRQCDVWLLTEKNVNLARMVLTGVQHKTITTKLPSGVPYLIPITPSGASILRRRMSMKKPGEFLFKKPMQKQWEKLRKLVGLPFVLLKDLRPSAATLLIDNAVHPLTAQNMLGHTTDRMLPTYVKQTIRHLREAAMKLEDNTSEILEDSNTH